MIPEDDIQKLLQEKHYQAAFEHLVERMKLKVFHLCMGILRDEASAHDAAQDCFVKVWRGLSGYGGQSALSTWVYTIARNTCLSELRRRAYRVSISLNEEGAEEIADPNSPPPGEGTPRLQTQEMASLLDRLSERHRRVLRLYYFEDCSYETVAEMLAIPLGTVKTDLYRAKKELLREFNRSQTHELRTR
ncbi:MAG: RNA polymerase sigma factor [Verrucomicrobiales bacterium]|nr:RNA polymerase sigma factor [Verrucomicrobiales bacterium]